MKKLVMVVSVVLLVVIVLAAQLACARNVNNRRLILQDEKGEDGEGQKGFDESDNQPSINNHHSIPRRSYGGDSTQSNGET
ncbi:hypothetical protein Syun_016349 [Stephania yunnanensis]|uniref:Uncharacterized protein n=1 Tax=Stephania yunnanensis TaxID=152371 RepID=A0AAP0P1A5_9MAGN